MAWISGYLSLDDAYNALARRAESNGYDAVIGIRFVAHPDADYSGGGNYTDGPDSRLRWTMYGTAIAWQAR